MYKSVPWCLWHQSPMSSHQSPACLLLPSRLYGRSIRQLLPQSWMWVIKNIISSLSNPLANMCFILILLLDLPPSSMGKPGNPCDPSPCGPYSRCLISSQGFATCSCLPGYEGSPPLCKPECVVSPECPPTKSCVNQKCVDPCTGVCGVGAHCYVMNHNPICACPANHIGDPFVMCTLPPGMKQWLNSLDHVVVTASTLSDLTVFSAWCAA